MSRTFELSLWLSFILFVTSAQGLNNKLNFKEDDEFRQYTRDNSPYYISCEETVQKLLYESDSKLPNCDDFMTYGIGMSVGGNAVVLAGLCYDLDKLSLKYVNFVAYPPEGNFFAIKTNSTKSIAVTLDTKIGNLEHYFNFMSNEEFEEHLSKKKSIAYLRPFDFDYVSLIQDEQLKDNFPTLENILNTIWWRGLRLGNWRFYLNALAERSEVVNYNVFLGSAGQVLLPATECEDHIVLSIRNGRKTITAPEYIWAYLKSINDDINEELVVIGFNSPYFLNKTSIEFCDDICDDFDWLKKSEFGQMRKFPTMGHVFCCRPHEVEKKLKNFPYKKSSEPKKLEFNSGAIEAIETMETTLPPLYNSLLPNGIESNNRI